MAGALVLSMGVSAVAAPCTALAQQTLTKGKELEQDSRYISPKEAIQIALGHAYDELRITPDKIQDLKVVHSWDDWDLPRYHYRVSFYSRANTRRFYTYTYYNNATNGFLIGWGY